jgi:ATP-dependent Clp protease ATP-binding subunit ClpA
VFDRFTPQAQAAVVAAQDEARRHGADEIFPEHLLVGALAQADAPVVADLGSLGVTPATARQLLDAAAPADQPASPDARALAALGIDLDDVESRVAAEFGPGALPPPPPAEHIPFSPGTRHVLERSLAEAAALGSEQVGVGHVLLALLDPAGNTATVLLSGLAVDPAAARAAVLGADRD